MPKGKVRAKKNLLCISGVWYARWWEEGREKRRSLRTHDAGEAAEKLKALLKEVGAEQARVRKLPGGRLLWEEGVGRYIAEIAPNSVKPNTLKRYIVSYRQVAEHLEGASLHEIDNRMLMDIINQRRLVDEVTNATLNRDLTAISQVLGCGMDVWEACTENAAHSFNRKRLTREVRLPRDLPGDALIERYAAMCPGMLADGVRIARAIGARQEELFGLKWNKVDLESGRVTFLRTKSNKPRTIRLSDEARALFAGLPQPIKRQHVLWHGISARYENVSSRYLLIRRRLQEVLKGEARDEWQDFSFHDLRHCYAVAELHAGRDIYDLSGHLGA
jgi:integrase